MALDTMRISQALPTIKCTECSATISLDDMSYHVCRRKANRIAPIAEDGPVHNRGLESRREPWTMPKDRGERRTNGDEQRYPFPERPHFPTANASTVLGKIHSIKTGVLDSNGIIRRPAPMQRFGPVQTRDPRATMIPLRTEMHDRGPRPPPSRGTRQPADCRVQDDNRSIISERSVRSEQSNGSSSSRSNPRCAGNNVPREDHAASISSNDSGPFHHVSSRLDPAIFVPADVPLPSKKKKSSRSVRPRKNAKDVYDESWEEQGEDTYLVGRPSTAASETRSIHSSSSTTSSSLSRPQPNPSYRQENNPQRHKKTEEFPSTRHHTAVPNQSVGAASKHDTASRAQIRPVQERPIVSRYHYLRPEAHSNPVSSGRTHSRNETSSSMGTVLTNASMLSARSSISSPPSSEANYLSREDLHTPTPLDHAKADITPTYKSKIPEKSGIPRSATNGSFDRLLQDIGASLDAPAAPFAKVEDSPSSTYSPTVPSASGFTSPPRPQRVLGSPASLHSKSTSSSRQKSRVECRACRGTIIGKSVSSADGKLSGRYHKSCFLCRHPGCGVPFTDGQFYVYQDTPYCARHYHARAGSLCAHCGEGIEGECLATVDDRRYHVHCHSARPMHGRQYERF